MSNEGLREPTVAANYAESQLDRGRKKGKERERKKDTGDKERDLVDI